MAEIRIQPKKSAPSPWLLVLLAAGLLAAAAYFFLRPDPAEGPVTTPATTATANPSPPAGPPTAEPAGGEAATGPESTSVAADDAAPTTTDASDAVPTPAGLAAYAATDAAAPGYGRRGLAQLTAAAVDLADRADLQDPAIQEQRNNLTSATARLSEDANAPLRPGFVAVASLLRAIQQKGYSEQNAAAAQLQQLAGQLSGRTATAPEQQQTRQFLSGAAALLEALSQPVAAP